MRTEVGSTVETEGETTLIDREYLVNLRNRIADHPGCQFECKDKIWIDGLLNMVDPDQGFDMTIVLNQGEPFLWSVFDGMDIQAILEEEGWRKIGQLGAATYMNNQIVEGKRLKDPNLVGVSTQFYGHHLKKCLNSRIILVQNSYDYIQANGYEPEAATVLEFLIKTGEFDDLKTVALMNMVDKQRGLSHAKEYFWQRYEWVLNDRLLPLSYWEELGRSYAREHKYDIVPTSEVRHGKQ